VGDIKGPPPEAGAFVEVRAQDGGVLGYGHWGTRGIAIRMLSHERGGHEDALIVERIQAAVALRAKLALVGSTHTTGYRLVHGEGDLLPGLVVDVYGATAVVQCHSAGMWRLRQRIGELVHGHSELGVTEIVFRKVDGQIEESEDGEDKDNETQTGELEGGRVVSFREGGLHFLVDPERGQKTGFFLDQRINRGRVRDLARGRNVLNAFCYTGAFSVYALAGEAASVVSVDASKPALEMCRRNVEANFPGARHETLAADCFSYLADMPQSFDLVILDPPAFVKHQRALQRGLKGYETINTHAFRRIPKGGLLATFSCSQLVSREMFRESVQRAAGIAGRSVRILEAFGQAPCHPVNLFHPEGEYLKGLLLYVE